MKTLYSKTIGSVAISALMVFGTCWIGLPSALAQGQFFGHAHSDGTPDAGTTVRNSDGSQTTTFEDGWTRKTETDHSFGRGGTKVTEKDDRGRLKGVFKMGPKGDLRFRTLVNYNADGTRTIMYEGIRDGCWTSRTTETVDANGKTTRRTTETISADGRNIDTVSDTYLSNGNVIHHEDRKPIPEPRKETATSVGQDAARNAAKDTARDVAQDTAKNVSRDVGKDAGHSTACSGPSQPCVVPPPPCPGH